MKTKTRALTGLAALSLLIPVGLIPSADAATSVVGRTTVGTSTEVLNSNYQIASKIVTNAGRLTEAKVYLDGRAATTGSSQVKVNIYGSGGGGSSPVELMGSSSIKTINAGKAAGWEAFVLPNISVGQNWVVWASVQSTANTVTRLYRNTTGGTGAWGAAGNINTPPDPFYSPTLTTNNYSINLTVDDAPVVTPTPTPTPTPTVDPNTVMPTTAKPGWVYSYGQPFDVPAALGTFGDSAPYLGQEGYDCFDCDTAGKNADSGRPAGQGGSYRPDKSLSVSNGMLDMHLFHEASTGEYVMAAPFPKHPTTGQQGYTGMRTSVRFKAEGNLEGTKTAWLLWPESWSWNDGEIDFPEGSLDDTIHGFSHEAGPNPSRNTLAVSTNARYTDWHTAVTEWIPKTATSPGSVEFFLDGVSIGKTTDSVPSQAMHWTLQTETQIRAEAPPTTLDGRIKIDWLTVETK